MRNPPNRLYPPACSSDYDNRHVPSCSVSARVVSLSLLRSVLALEMADPPPKPGGGAPPNSDTEPPFDPLFRQDARGGRASLSLQTTQGAPFGALDQRLAEQVESFACSSRPQHSSQQFQQSSAPPGSSQSFLRDFSGARFADASARHAVAFADRSMRPQYSAAPPNILPGSSSHHHHLPTGPAGQTSPLSLADQDFLAGIERTVAATSVRRSPHC